MAFFDLPLDLGHAGTVAHRIAELLERRAEDDEDGRYSEAIEAAERLAALLLPYSHEEYPPQDEAVDAARRAAELARHLVDLIELASIGSDRLGQYVRNLFECLELGREGADISLRAGEDPTSVMRP